MQSEKWEEKQETKKTTNTKKKQRKNRWRNTKTNFIFKRIVAVKHGGYPEGTCQNDTSNIHKTMRKKASTQHTKKELKSDKKRPKPSNNNS